MSGRTQCSPSSSCSYLNIFEGHDLKTEEEFFKANPDVGKFYNKVIIGTVIPPPQHEPSLIKVQLEREEYQFYILLKRLLSFLIKGDFQVLSELSRAHKNG